jgi:UDPglucose--hexose-1-phosphate uridylyltransferase
LSAVPHRACRHRLPARPARRSGRLSALTAPEVRIDQLTGLRAILAPGRAERPEAFAAAAAEPRPDAAESCPFCAGREGRTPPEVWAERPDGGEPDTPGWTSRAVPNLYPVVADPGGDRRGSTSSTSRGQPQAASRESGIASSIDPLHDSTRGAEPDLFRSAPATGGHEVIVHAPEHSTSLATLSEERFAGAVAAWRERMGAYPHASYVHLIVNEGPEAGASLEHSHAQLYALGFVPTAVARERERAAAYHERTMGSHLLGDVLAEEVRRRERLVAIDEDAALICPWASRSPFELRVIPRRSTASFEADHAGTGMLRAALRALATAFGRRPQINLWVRTAPRGTEEFCWHIDVVPRLTIRAGFELGAGVDVNVYPPERAAADLREALE